MHSPKQVRAYVPLISLLPLLLTLFVSAARAAEFPRGVLIEKVVCQADASQSYALYLPSAYTPQKKWPVIYAFDPSGLGNEPVELYREAAEKYGYIVAGSYNSENGMQPLPLRTAIVSLLDDTRGRLSIDDRRIYTTGFSGGARVATRVASSCAGCIAGVIACGAGFPPDIKPTQAVPFAYFATVGIEDFNYPELRRLDGLLASLNLPHYTATFAGRHQWASSQLLTEAVEWMEVQAMRAGRRERDEALLEAVLHKRLERARAADAAKNPYEAYLAYAALAADFKSLKDVAEYEKRAAQLKESKEVRQALKSEQEQLTKQLELAQQIIGLGGKLLTEPAARSSAMKDMRAEISELREKSKATEDTAERRIARRALSQVLAQTFEAAMYHYHPDGQYDVAIVNLEVAEEVAPKISQIPYEMARAYALRGEKKKALESLRRAVEKGFPDAAAIENQKDFASLRAEDEFKSIINSLKEARPPKSD
jgi:dienelactone hydrolase